MLSEMHFDNKFVEIRHSYNKLEIERTIDSQRVLQIWEHFDGEGQIDENLWMNIYLLSTYAVLFLISSRDVQ